MKTRHLILGLSFATLLSVEASAQHSLASKDILSRQMARIAMATDRPLAYDVEYLLSKQRFATEAQRRDWSLLSQLLGQGVRGDELVERYLQKNPDSFSKERIKLLLALYTYEVQERSEGIKLLEEIEPRGLHLEEREQWQCLRGYLALQRGTKADADRAIALLRPLTENGQGLWSERARLYWATATWLSDTNEAERILESGLWSDELLPEVEYLGVMMSFEKADPSSAITQAHKLMARFPEYKDHPRLLGVIGQAYYIQGDDTEAIRSLAPLATEGKLSPQESYALGAAYYRQARYDEALAPLQEATKLGREEQVGFSSSPRLRALGAEADFALANIYKHQGKKSEAKLAFGSVLSREGVDLRLKEEAHYQLIELGFSHGGDSFGELARQTELFFALYPQSKYRGRILDILAQSLTTSKDHSANLRLIDRLLANGTKDTKLLALKQEVLLSYALETKIATDERQSLLDEAIKLGRVSQAYGIAILARAEERIHREEYRDAERDLRLALGESYIPSYENGIAKYLLGYSLYNQKRYEEASTPLSQFAHSRADAQLRANALLRLADIYSLKVSGAEDATKHYRKAIELSHATRPEAYTRLVHLLGQRGRYSEQITTIESAEKQLSLSSLAPLRYAKGRALVMLGRSNEALQVFHSVETDYPLEQEAPRSALERALIYSNMGQEREALSAYKTVLSKYPESAEARTALSDLRSLYAEGDKLDEYARYVSSLPKALQPEGDDESHLAYLTLESRQKRGEATFSDLESFLIKYPDARDRTKVEDLLVGQYISMGKTEEAIQTLSKILSLSQEPKRAQELSQKLGSLLRSTARAKEAIPHYIKAIELSGGLDKAKPELASELSHCAYEAGDYAQSRKLTSKLLERPDLDSQMVRQLRLLQGKSQEGEKALQTAIATYDKLSNESATAEGAEATVRRAALLLKLSQTTEAKEILQGFVSSGTPQQYWLARGFIVLSDCYAKEGDHYLAEQYLQSLKENYQGTEADIQELINERLKKK